MKKTTFITILTIFPVIFTSCNQQKTSDLNNEIAELKKQNAILKDSISKNDLNNIYSFHILGTTKKNSLKVNEEATIDFIFGYRNHIKNYNVYRLTGDKENERELILQDQKISEFKYSYTPKDKNDNRIKLMTVFDLDSISVEIPADITLNVTD